MIRSGEHELWQAHLEVAPMRARANGLLEAFRPFHAAMREAARTMGVAGAVVAERMRQSFAAMQAASTTSAELERQFSIIARGGRAPEHPSKPLSRS